MRIVFLILIFLFLIIYCQLKEKYDIIIRNGMIYDGSGGILYYGDIGIKNDNIAFIGNFSKASATNETDATGMAVPPVLINMLSWVTKSLKQNGRPQSNTRQGVTLK